MDLALMAGDAVALWTGLHLVLLLVLSGLVVRQRRRHRIAIGDGGVPELARALRAFGNATEYVPGGLVALAALALAGAEPPIVHAIGATLFAGRVAHGVGLTLTAGPSIGRMVGMLLTWIAYLAAAICLLLFSM